jgi:hypothetical protein
MDGSTSPTVTVAARYMILTGQLLDTLTSSSEAPDGTGRTFLTLDDQGSLYSWDAATGLNVFDVGNATPEPSAVWLFGLGVAGLVASRRIIRA